MKRFENKKLYCLDRYYVISFNMVASVLNIYRLFFVIIPLTILNNNYLHSVYIVLGITSDLEII